MFALRQGRRIVEMRLWRSGAAVASLTRLAAGKHCAQLVEGVRSRAQTPRIDPRRTQHAVELLVAELLQRDP